MCAGGRVVGEGNDPLHTLACFQWSLSWCLLLALAWVALFNKIWWLKRGHFEKWPWKGVYLDKEFVGVFSAIAWNGILLVAISCFILSILRVSKLRVPHLLYFGGKTPSSKARIPNLSCILKSSGNHRHTRVQVPRQRGWSNWPGIRPGHQHIWSSLGELIVHLRLWVCHLNPGFGGTRPVLRAPCVQHFSVLKSSMETQHQNKRKSKWDGCELKRRGILHKAHRQWAMVGYSIIFSNILLGPDNMKI